MQAPLLLLLVPSVLGYLDVTVFQVDTRDENSQGLVNPYALAQLLCTHVFQNLSTSASNDEAWAQLQNAIYSTYQGPIAQQVMALFENGALVVNDYLAANQEVYVGNYIDTFNLLVTGQRNASAATRRGLALMQAAGQTVYNGILRPLSNLFYNPFDTEMLSTLNDTSIFKMKANLFQMARGASYYAPGSPSYYYYHK